MTIPRWPKARMVFAGLLIGSIAALALAGCDQAAEAPAPDPTPGTQPSPVVAIVPESGDDQPATQVPTERAATYVMGVFSEPITGNYWNYVGGPGGSVWTGYAIGGYHSSLFNLSDQRFDWVPSLAADFPGELVLESVVGRGYWTTEVSIRPGVRWSDGEEVDAEDVRFTVQTVLDLGLGAGWSNFVNPDFVDHIEVLDSHTLKIYFRAADADGQPQVPGLSVWQFGLGFMPVLPEHYWRPVVEAARNAGDQIAQVEALYAHVPVGEPTNGGFEHVKWERGAFFQNTAVENYSFAGTQVTQFDDGSIRRVNPVLGYEETILGEAGGEIVLDYAVGPHFDDSYFYIYGNQDAAILALTDGEVDYVFNPLGLERGFRDRAQAAGDLQVVTNAPNGTRYLGFNVRKPPFDSIAFRQAVATLIDKEFVTQTVLQAAAFPQYSMVPEGNPFWHNPDADRIGEGLSRAERIARAVALLEGAGFRFEQKPVVSADGNFVEIRGSGLTMPDGQPVPPMELIAPSAGYDPLRATFAIWIERWLNDVGIPARANLAGFNVIVDRLFSATVAEDLDMWILGWAFGIFPDHLQNFFHSRYAPENQKGGNNWGGFADPEFDALADEFLEATTFSRAQDLARQMQALIATKLPYVTLFETATVDVFRPSKVEFPYTDVLGGIEQAGGLQLIALIK